MSRPEWSLRLARTDDAAAMPEVTAGGTRSAADYTRLIRKGHSLVAHVGEAMAGFVVTEPFRRELHVWELAVLSAHRRRGIGQGLVRAAQIDARNTGIKALTLITDREHGAPFFARLGFEEVTALDAHIRLAGELAVEADNGLAAETRCAMICFLD